MKVINTPIPDLKIIDPTVFEDKRGFFFESYNCRKLREAAGIEVPFVQDNQSYSSRGVLRGLHYQLEPWAQAKLVSVVLGEVYDVAVDIRKGSPTFGQHFGCILSAENKRQLYIPRGFAHGFAVISDNALFFYKCDNYYAKEHERGIIYNDPHLAIDWQLPSDNTIVSDKDSHLPAFEDAEYNFAYRGSVQQA